MKHTCTVPGNSDKHGLKEPEWNELLVVSVAELLWARELGSSIGMLLFVRCELD